MASGSPTVHSRIKAAHSPMMRSRHFIEDSPRTRIELARNNLKMQKEIMKIEKQAKTAATNASNNQQALRMSLRHLEDKRNTRSPLITRSVKQETSEPTGSRRKLGLFANDTSLTVQSTADAYRSAAAAGRIRSHTVSGHILEHADVKNNNDSRTDIIVTRADSDEQVFPTGNGNYRVATPEPFTGAEHQSPYISTPFNVRRMVRSKLSKPFHSLVPASSHHPITAPTKHHSKSHDLDNDSGNPVNLSDVRSSLKLPPISSARTVISAHHNTTDKATLKKASQLLGLSAASGTKSDGPISFQQFYKDAGAAASLVIVSPPSTPCGERDGINHMSSDSDEEGHNGETQNAADSSSSLSEMFEQIKKCRYIRHYYPNGQRPPEEAWY